MAITASGLIATAASPPASGASGLGWASESIGYIYVYLRGKVDAERAPATPDGGACRCRGDAVRRPQRARGSRCSGGGVSPRPDRPARGDRPRPGPARRRRRRHGGLGHPPAGRGHAARRRGGDRGGQLVGRPIAPGARPRRSCAPPPPIGAPPARASGGSRTSATRLERALKAAGDAPPEAARAADLTHQIEGLTSEQRALEEQVARLDRQLADLRAKAAALRDTAAEAKAKLDHAVAARRKAASAMAASIAGRQRDRGDAEREVADLTAQLGRATAQVRPQHMALLSSYQNIDRLADDDRRSVRPARGPGADPRTLRPPQALDRRRPAHEHADRRRRGAVGRSSSRRHRFSPTTIHRQPSPLRVVACSSLLRCSQTNPHAH